MNSDLLIKQFTINILVYLVTFKILNIKITSYRQWVKITSASVLTTITYAILKKYMAIPFLIIVSFILQNIFLSFFIKENISIFITNLVANAITYIIYTLATIIEILPLTILNINNNFCNFILITLISIILFYIFSKIKRIKNGMKFLRDTKSQEYVEIIAINIKYCCDICIHLIWQLLWQFDKAYFDFIYYFRYYYVCYDSKNIGFIL